MLYLNMENKKLTLIFIINTAAILILARILPFFIKTKERNIERIILIYFLLFLIFFLFKLKKENGRV